MNAVNEAIKYIIRHIPKTVLKYAYEKTYPQYTRQVNITMEEFILSKIINNIVINDYNILGVMEETIPLAGLPYEFLDIEDNLSISAIRPIVVYIPRSKTQGRRIVNVSSTLFMPSQTPYDTSGYTSRASMPCNSSALSIGARNILNKAVGKIDTSFYNTKVELIGPNAVLIEGIQNISFNTAITCTFSGDECLSHLRSTGILIFRELCLYAAQFYIYNQCIIDIDEGEIRLGVNVSKLKEIIEEYRDSGSLYDTLLKEKFIRVAFMHDTNKIRRWNDMIGTVFNT